MKHEKTLDTNPGANTFCLNGKFHDADIENELILGCPWLQENNLEVLPAEEALACGLQNEILLGGWELPKIDSRARPPGKFEK